MLLHRTLYRLRFSLSYLLILMTFPLTPLSGQVEKITWRGWPDCYRISHSHCELIINTSTGGRVLSFSSQGENVMYENPAQNGKMYPDWLADSFDPDGGRFDYGPEGATQKKHALTWMGPWQAEITGTYSLKLTSEVDSVLGLQSTREFVLDPDAARLSIHQTGVNRSAQPQTFHFWGRTLVKPHGVLWMPRHPDSRFEAGWGRFLWNPNRIESRPAVDPRIQIEPQLFRFEAHGTTLKGGTDAAAGWMAYVLGEWVFMKRFAVDPEASYAGSDHMTGIFYSNGKFAELEPCSPTYTVSPGDSFSFSEHWELSHHPEGWTPANK